MLNRNQSTTGDDLSLILKMADGLAEMLSEYGVRKRTFSMKTWASFVEAAHTLVMEFHMIQFEAATGQITNHFEDLPK